MGRSRGRSGLARTVVVIGLLASVVRAAEPESPPDRPYWRTNLFKRVATDQKYLLTRWFPQEIRRPAFASALGVGVALAFQSEGERASGRFVSASASGPAPAVRGVTWLGDGAALAGALGIGYLAARRSHHDRFASATSLAGEALLDAGIWSATLKAATARARPRSQEPGEFAQFGRPGSDSFPSGHTMAAFSVAAVFAESYREHRWVPWVAYGTATLVGGSRIALGRHYPSDVFVGALLGASLGRAVVARNEGHDASRGGSIEPVLGPEGRGVGIGWSRKW